MAFTAKQTILLKRNLDPRHVRTREAHGKQISYIEGWYAVAEANRIFGFDGWSRETTETKCVFSREARGCFTAIYIAKVRITVSTENDVVTRDGHGTGEGRGTFPGDVHDIALKAAETDATKRALATFGKPFGLALYGRPAEATPSVVPSDSTGLNDHAGSLGSLRAGAEVPSGAVRQVTDVELRRGFHPDDTTPIPRPSRFYGREQYHASRERAARGTSHGRPANPTKVARDKSADRAQTDPGLTSQSNQPTRQTETPRVQQAPRIDGQNPLVAPPTPPDAPNVTIGSTITPILAPSLAPTSDVPAGRIDKSVLTLGEPKRLRDRSHLRFVASQPCLICDRQPSDPHHLRFAQPRALGLKVSDEFTVPLCRIHHRQLHNAGNEVAWWDDLHVDALEIAKGLWEESHGRNQTPSLNKAQVRRIDPSAPQCASAKKQPTPLD